MNPFRLDAQQGVHSTEPLESIVLRIRKETNNSGNGSPLLLVHSFESQLGVQHHIHIANKNTTSHSNKRYETITTLFIYKQVSRSLFAVGAVGLSLAQIIEGGTNPLLSLS